MKVQGLYGGLSSPKPQRVVESRVVGFGVFGHRSVGGLVGPFVLPRAGFHESPCRVDSVKASLINQLG